MNIKSLNSAASALATVLALGMSTGCSFFTGRLWQPDMEKGLHAPARPIHLQVYAASDRSEDVLVEYDEAAGRPPVVTRRYYWLKKHQAEMGKETAPTFEGDGPAADLRPLKVVREALPNGRTGEAFVWVSTTSNEFKIRNAGALDGDYYLPVYGEVRPLAKRILMTPVTVLADTSVIGAVVAAGAGVAGAGAGGGLAASAIAGAVR